MDKEDLVAHMDKRLSRWTLTFHDPKQEEQYQQAMNKGLHLPKLLRIATYVSIVLQAGYRVLAIIMCKTGGPLQTGTFHEEVASLTFIIVTIMAELLLRRWSKYQKWQGLCLYTGFPLINIAGAFFTQRAPRMGLLFAVSDS